MGPFDRKRNLPRESFQQVTLLRKQQAATLDWLNGEHTERMLRARERQILSSSGRKRVGPEARRPAMVENPLCD